MQGQSLVYLVLAVDLIHFLDVPVRPAVVVVLPLPAPFPGIPGQCAEYLRPGSEFIDRKFTAQPRVVFQYGPNVVDGFVIGTGVGIPF